MTNYGNSFTEQILENNQGKTVVSFPAGTGKTSSAIEYMANNFLATKIIYVSQTIKALDEVEEKLLELNVPKKTLFKYHSMSDDLNNLTQQEINEKCLDSQIILITHARLLFDSPYNYQYRDVLGNDSTVIVDESVNPIITVSFLYSQAESWVETAKLLRPKFKDFELDKSRNKYVQNTVELANAITKLMLSEKEDGVKTPVSLGMSISEGERSFCPTPKNQDRTNDEQIRRRIENLYECIARQITHWNFTYENGKIKIIVPISIPETWFTASRNTFILDATGYLYKGFYKSFKFINSNSWNWDKVHLHIIDNYINPNGKIIDSLSKTKITKDLTLEDYYRLLWNIPWDNYKRIYFVTFKGKYELRNIVDSTEAYFEEESDNNSIMQNCVDYLEDDLADFTIIDNQQYNEEEKIIHLTNYGRTRGSNAFRNCDCVVLFGNYRFNWRTMEQISSCYDGVTSDNISLANFIQEIYRSRIRCDEPIDVWSFNDALLTKAIQNEGIPFEHIELANTEELALIKRKSRISSANMYVQLLEDCKEDISYSNLKRVYQEKYADNGRYFDRTRFRRDLERQKDLVLTIISEEEFEWLMKN